MIQSVIFFTFLLVNCGAAPAGPERIGLSLEAIPPELITTANDQIASLRSTAAEKAVAINGLVGTASETIGAGYTAPKGNPFADPPRKIEMAVVEVESPLSQVESVKDNIYGFFSGIFQPQPVVDTIKEEEKYGNSGDKFAPIGKALVGTTEGLANFVSNAVNVPFDVFKQITRSASEKLNNLGGRLIGL